jgi:hypothetical protein
LGQPEDTSVQGVPFESIRWKACDENCQETGLELPQAFGDFEPVVAVSEHPVHDQNVRLEDGSNLERLVAA